MQHTSFNFDNSYFRELEGLYAPMDGAKAPAPKIMRLNHRLAAELGLDPAELDSEQGANYLSGSVSPPGAQPLAMVYAGHQFGGYSPQLGDGRAILVGEMIDPNNKRHDLHLKGSGRTPFSRNGDGKAAVQPVLREYLLGEAMHALGVPSTRALAAVSTGEDILREGYKPGAVLARVASSHLRVGTFQYAAARGDTDKLRELADYAIARHYPDLLLSEDRYLGLLRSVRDAQAELVAHWVCLGFVHGVMNTDNVTISGETIDYGPCAFIDTYDPATVFSSIDRDGRYAYGNQPNITQWNLARFAETLLPLIDADNPEHAVQLATDELTVYPEIYQRAWLKHMRKKLGLSQELDTDLDLCNDLLASMVGQEVDYTRLFRSLSDVVRADDKAAVALFSDATDFKNWLQSYQQRIQQEADTPDQIAAAMNNVNPVYIPRNHLVEEALNAALSDNLLAFDTLLDVLLHPFEERTGLERYKLAAPDDFGPYTTFCGT